MGALDLIFAGSGEFGRPTLASLMEKGHRIVHVYSQPDRPAGRGKRLTPTPITQFAIDRNLPVTRTENINQETLPPADLLVVIAFGQKIAPHVVRHCRLEAVNLHASRLPKYRGAAPINRAILDGETVTGNSIIRLAAKMDAGAVLAQSELVIDELETAGELHDRLALDGAALMGDVIDKLGKGQAVETPQNESQATMAAKLSRQSARIEWTRPAGQIARQIRGLFPWPGCRVRALEANGDDAGRLTLVRALPIQASGATPGTIDARGWVGAGEGCVEVVEVQPEGKRPMSLEAYRNGHPWREGLRLESV